MRKGKTMSLPIHYLNVILCYLNLITMSYATDFDFKDAYENCREGRTWNKYVLHDDLLYRANKLLFLLVPFASCFCWKHMEVA
jgi:hypothetical protein